MGDEPKRSTQDGYYKISYKDGTKPMKSKQGDGWQHGATKGPDGKRDIMSVKQVSIDDIKKAEGLTDATEIQPFKQPSFGDTLRSSVEQAFAAEIAGLIGKGIHWAFNDGLPMAIDKVREAWNKHQEAKAAAMLTESNVHPIEVKAVVEGPEVIADITAQALPAPAMQDTRKDDLSRASLEELLGMYESNKDDQQIITELRVATMARCLRTLPERSVATPTETELLDMLAEDPRLEDPHVMIAVANGLIALEQSGEGAENDLIGFDADELARLIWQRRNEDGGQGETFAMVEEYE